MIQTDCAHLVQRQIINTLITLSRVRIPMKCYFSLANFFDCHSAGPSDCSVAPTQFPKSEQRAELGQTFGANNQRGLFARAVAARAGLGTK